MTAACHTGSTRPSQTSVLPQGRAKGAPTYNVCRLLTETKPSQPPPGREDVAVAETRQSWARRCAKGATRLFSLGPARAAQRLHRHARSRVHGRRPAEVTSPAQDHTARRLAAHSTRIRGCLPPDPASSAAGPAGGQQTFAGSPPGSSPQDCGSTATLSSGSLASRDSGPILV